MKFRHAFSHLFIYPLTNVLGILIISLKMFSTVRSMPLSRNPSHLWQSHKHLMSEIASHKIFNLPHQILPVTYQILSQISFSEHSSHNNNKWVIFIYTRTCILFFYIPPSLLSDVEKLWNSYKPHHMNLISIFIVLILHIRIL